MKWLISLLAAATGVLHILIGLNILDGNPADGINPLLIANGAGFLVLLVLFLSTSGSTRRTIRWIFLAYTLITLIGYFLLGGGFDNTWAIVTKAIELLLAILLLLERGSDVEKVGAAVGAATAAAGGAAVAAGTRAKEFGVDVVDTAGEVAGRAGAAAGEAVAEVEEALEGAGEAVGDMTEGALDIAGRAGEAVVDAGQAVGAAVAGAAAGAIDFLRGPDGEKATPDQLRANLTDYFKSFGSGHEFSKDIEYIEGIGTAHGGKLRNIGINKVIDLMVNGATRDGRKDISDRSGIASSLILTWVNHTDLYRIKGVAQEYADLLEESGVDTVVELAQRNPENLHKKMVEINEDKKLVRRLPHESDVVSWVDQAKDLPRVIFY